MTFENWPPCQASGELARLLGAQLRARDRLRVALADRVRVPGVGLVAAGDHDGRQRRARASSSQVSNGARARDGVERVGDRLGVLVGGEPLVQDPGRSSRASARARSGSP